MSRKGNKALDIPAGVTVTVNQNNVNVAGPKGKLDIPFPHVIHVKVENNQVRVSIWKQIQFSNWFFTSSSFTNSRKH